MFTFVLSLGMFWFRLILGSLPAGFLSDSSEGQGGCCLSCSLFFKLDHWLGVLVLLAKIKDPFSFTRVCSIVAQVVLLCDTIMGSNPLIIRG